MFVFDYIGQTVQHFRQRPAGFAGPDHTAVQRRKNLGVFAKCFMQTGAFFDVLVHFAENTAQLGIFSLLLEDLQ